MGKEMTKGTEGGLDRSTVGAGDRGISPGKVTRVSKLPGQGRAIQREASASPGQSPNPAAGPARDPMTEIWMDAAHRGLAAFSGTEPQPTPAGGPESAAGSSPRGLAAGVGQQQATASGAGSGTYRVTTSTLNVRASPAVAPDNKLGALSKGEELKVSEVVDGWARFLYRGQQGYASAKYMEPVSRKESRPDAVAAKAGTEGRGEEQASWWDTAVSAARQWGHDLVSWRSEPSAEPAAQQTAQAEGYQDAPADTSRERWIETYKRWLTTRYAEMETLRGNAKAQRVEGLLKQMEDVCGRLNQGHYTDISKLSTTPSSAGRKVDGAFVPPELIGTARSFIEILEQGVAGATRSQGAVVEGSQHSSVDWNSRLGVPTYRNQLDNLVAGEATCNVTSTSMALERLGLSRQDVMAAVERLIKEGILKSEGKAVTPENLASVKISDATWQSTVKSYLDKINNDTKAYRRIRGQSTTNAKRTELAGQYKGNAQMEDVLDLLCELLGVSRYDIVGDPSKILKAVVPDATKRPRAQQLWKWNADTVKELKNCLARGGTAIVSLRHKGRGATGTHLISVQAVSGTSIIVDDPYGGMRSDYRGNEAGDAYANAGKTRSASGHRNERHESDWEDWKSSRAQHMDANEERGESHTLPDELVKTSFNYITLYHRAAH